MEPKYVEQRFIKAGGDVAAGDINKDNTYINISEANFYEAVKALPSNLASVVNVLGKRLLNKDSGSASVEFSIQGKIEHNNVQEYKYIMDKYGLLVGKLTAVYDEFDSSGSDTTLNTLANVNLVYDKVKMQYMRANRGRVPLDVVREFADEIFSKVEDGLLKILKESSNLTVSYESIHLSLQVIMIDAFIKCEILEKPSDATS